MKLVKLSIIALCLGIFATSCGNGSGDASKKDSTATMAPATTAPAAPAKMDTPTAAPAKPDTASTAPAAK